MTSVSLVASQRSRLTLCVQASRKVPRSNSRTRGAAINAPSSTGTRLSQPTKFMSESQ
jgi:hypothetical protein